MWCVDGNRRHPNKIRVLCAGGWGGIRRYWGKGERENNLNITVCFDPLTSLNLNFYKIQAQTGAETANYAPPNLKTKINQTADWLSFSRHTLEIISLKSTGSALTTGPLYKLPSLQMKWCERSSTFTIHWLKTMFHSLLSPSMRAATERQSKVTHSTHWHWCLAQGHGYNSEVLGHGPHFFFWLFGVCAPWIVCF